ncbi:uncharacterized protein K452DRAFT_277733 [Aplosporella prunicola CBS 121167]|uniref:BIR-domain-containing protein n=1 Tax=Aplosporella prunicola CBS 121167 TaxID=1176127 RepID=A0A6A6B1I3_9PEZI|nr:uncharacterized protein K452DRAFT_277733 [Aplosporella prunicola CBS 121167]KAF2138039.1 hypothetical protein K452DRAFT_277733 [Aplosporella prunicola CBS 121167]
MAAPDDVASFVGRVATFEAPKQLTKRRASSTTKRKAPTTVSWPHTAPSVEDLARAGFYYTPTASNPDNVTCFSCHRKLDGWEPEDNPALEHLTHAPECAWAINTSVMHLPVEELEDPLSERMTVARTATFLNWPHEDKKGWKCKTKKMAEAGWCFDPSPDYEDGVTCFYCLLSLDGWEPKDNPAEEHHRRSPDCSFFALAEDYAPTRKATKGKRGRASTASKASRLSIQSNNFDTFSDAPSFMSLGDDAVRNDDSIVTSATGATTTSMAKGKKATTKAKSTAKGTKKTTRGKKATEESESVLELDQPTLEPADADGDLTLGDIEADEGDSALSTATTASKAGRGRKTAAKSKSAAKATTRKTSKAKKAADSTLLDEEPAEAVDDEAESELPKPIGRATRRTSRLEVQSYPEVAQAEPVPEPEPKKPKATRAKGGRKDKAVEESRLSNDQSQLQTELQDAVEKADELEPPKPTSGTKRTSDGAPKLSGVEDSSIMVVDEPPKPAPKAKRGRKPKKVEAPAPEPVPEPAEDATVDAESATAPAPKAPAAAKPKRGRKPKAQAVEESTIAEPEPEPTLDEMPAPPPPMKSSASKVPVRNMASAPPKEPSPEPEPEPESEQIAAPEQDEVPTPHEDDPEPEEDQEQAQSPAQSSNSPAPPHELSSSPSAQSSDAENKPPSSRPASTRPPLSARQMGTRIPLADSSSTPQASPSKRNANNGGLASTHPWRPVDLENVFLPSPQTKRILQQGGVYAGTSKEDSADAEEQDMEDDDWEALSPEEQIAYVMRSMTDREKKMSVEEWVYAQAEKGEQRLREKCERLVGLFETQGTRAIRAVEGIDCV